MVTVAITFVVLISCSSRPAQKRDKNQFLGLGTWDGPRGVRKAFISHLCFPCLPRAAIILKQGEGIYHKSKKRMTIAVPRPSESLPSPQLTAMESRE